MQTVLLVAYMLIVVALIAVILLQRSEGGGLGMGGNAGGLMTVRGSANLLTRTTGVLAALFFATAIGLTILSQLDHSTSNILDQATNPATGAAPSTVLDALTQMQQQAQGASSAEAATTSGTTTTTTDPGLALPLTPPATDTTASAAAASEAAPQGASSAPPPAPAASSPLTPAVPAQ